MYWRWLVMEFDVAFGMDGIDGMGVRAFML